MNDKDNHNTAQGRYQALSLYARDLNDLARKGKLDPVIGRDDEIRRVLHILSRGTKHNPILIDVAGDGIVFTSQAGTSQ